MGPPGYQPIMAADGRWIQFANLLEYLFVASLAALGLTEEVAANPGYTGPPNRWSEEAREEVRNRMPLRARKHGADR
jgi:hypothetical protein